MPVRLADIVARFGGNLIGDGEAVIDGLGTLAGARSGDLSFLANPRYRKELANTRAGAVVLDPASAADCPVAAIATPQPYLYFARAAQWLRPMHRPASGVHPTAVVEGFVPASASIGPHVWVGAGAKVGENVVLEARCRIGRDAVVGDDSYLHPNVSVYSGCVIGARAIVHAAAVIGSDGFGFAREAEGGWIKIPQTGRVLIGDDVEIGAGTTIDRGALDDTVIGDGVKLDNQIQVGHNVRIGDHCAMAGCVGIAGSAVIGRRCTVGGGAVILGHLSIADDVQISAGTLISKSITRKGNFTGTVPFQEHAEWLRNFSRLRHLDAMADRIRALEARLAELEKQS